MMRRADRPGLDRGAALDDAGGDFIDHLLEEHAEVRAAR